MPFVPGTDIYDDLVAAIAALPAEGGKITLGAGRFYCSRKVDFKKFVILEGESSGEEGGYATLIEFPTNVAGFMVHRHNSGGGAGRADGSIFRNLALTCAREGTVGHGIELRARAEINNCLISKFGEDGIHIQASTPSGNANSWRIERCRVHSNGRHGLFVDGSDVNAGSATALSVVNNGGWGVCDSSFLGNTYIGCHAAANALGPYFSDNRNARNVFVGCYSEHGQPPSSLTQPTLVIGGLHAAGVTGSAQIIGDSRASPFEINIAGNARASEIRLGMQGSALSWIADDDHTNGLNVGYWNENSGTWDIRHARLDARVVMQFTTNLSKLRDEQGNLIPPGEVVLPNGFWVPSGHGKYRKVEP